MAYTTEAGGECKLNLIVINQIINRLFIQSKSYYFRVPTIGKSIFTILWPITDHSEHWFWIWFASLIFGWEIIRKEKRQYRINRTSSSMRWWFTKIFTVSFSSRAINTGHIFIISKPHLLPEYPPRLMHEPKHRFGYQQFIFCTPSSGQTFLHVCKYKLWALVFFARNPIVCKISVQTKKQLSL